MSKELYKSMNAENMEELVHAFYPKVLKDPILAPFFIAKLGDNIESSGWKAHLKLIVEFWKFAALGYDEYTNNPLTPHLAMEGLSREAFGQWLRLFHETVYEIYEPFAGDYLKDKSLDIAENFMRKLEI
ncbi:MAG: Globin [uncultured Sulfurovum sp.]|uniref:Globin n=1 Tax=uncultured Sulfurovum sp. TaxID=269237 RepID=A0A6S6SSK3_9BACT|nr:MAG: Globin [uncultured Sulfurovum sp.]